MESCAISLGPISCLGRASLATRQWAIGSRAQSVILQRFLGYIAEHTPRRTQQATQVDLRGLSETIARKTRALDLMVAVIRSWIRNLSYYSILL